MLLSLGDPVLSLTASRSVVLRFDVSYQSPINRIQGIGHNRVAKALYDLLNFAYIGCPNDDQTRNSIVAVTTEFLKSSFSKVYVVCDESNNSPEIIEKNEINVHSVVTP